MSTNKLSRLLELSVDPALVDPWDVEDLCGTDGYADFLLAKAAGVPWRDAALRTIGSGAGA